ncbi:hypothetical protein J6590_099364 [Homalodisca vitripennis]|nr:hypothetical protein J6590_099364 [Homalodisca vitripennis]
MPGARLLDIIKLNQSSPGPGPGPRCEVPAAVNPQHQHSGRLQHISYAEALKKYPVLDSDDKSGSAAAVPRGVSGAQAASMSPGGGVLAGATEASEYISPTIRQTDSQSTFLGSPLFGKGLS